MDEHHLLVSSLKEDMCIDIGDYPIFSYEPHSIAATRARISTTYSPSSLRTLRVTLRVLSVHRLDWVAALVGGRSRNSGRFRALVSFVVAYPDQFYAAMAYTGFGARWVLRPPPPSYLTSRLSSSMTYTNR
jgi:hypothetical protein